MSALPSFATIEDLDQRRPGGAGDFARAAAALDDVSTWIRNETNKLWVNTDGTLAANIPAVFLTVTCRAAIRILDNEAGVTTSSRSLGSYSETDTLANPTADMYLTKQEKAAVRAAAGINAVFTLSTTRGPVETANVECGAGGTVYLDTIPPGDLMPWTVEP